MPTISEFYGIAIRMYHTEHDPPHFHAVHAGSTAAFALDGRMLNGRMHLRAIRLVREWARLHRTELGENWARARTGVALVRIAPLE